MPETTDADLLVQGYLSAYRGNTRSNYETDVARFLAWLQAQEVTLLSATRMHVQTYRYHLEDRGLAPATVSRHLTCIAGLYRYAEEEELIRRSPARYVKRPYVPDESTSTYLDREEVGRYLAAAEADGVMSHALVCLLLINGLRVSEAVTARIEGISFDGGHRLLAIMGKGSRPAHIPLPPRAWRAVMQAIGERTSGPILLNQRGRPMTRHNASRITHRVARVAGIPKSIGPHACRHTFCTSILDAGVSPRLAQTAMRHADPSSTVRYDRTRFNMDKHAAYVMAAIIGT